MSDKNNKQADTLAHCIEEAIPVLKESNKQARKRNRLAKQQYKQSVLNYEQVERQYLIEKSRLQPTFKLSVTEFLTCEPDFVNDPEQAGEAKFLADLGVSVDERVLRIKLQVKNDAQYMQPSIVIQKAEQDEADERIIAMSDLLYFMPVNSVYLPEEKPCIDVFLVYRDKTTLPVIHKYQFSQRHDSALLRWDVSHLDTVYVSSHKDLPSFNRAAGCAALFSSREES